MNSWFFLFKNLGQKQQIFGQQLRTVFVFIILYLVILLPTLPLSEGAKPGLGHLLILQGLCVITVIMQVEPLIRSDVQDGFLERWLGGQGLGFQYYTVRQLIIFLEISLPTAILALFFAPSLPLIEQVTFFSLSLINMTLTALWASSMALLLAGNHDIGQSLVGMIFAALLLLPQLLVGQVILEKMVTNPIAMSPWGLYAGISIIGMALNLGLAPTIVRLSVSH